MNPKEIATPYTTAQIFNIIRQNGEINRMGITEISGVSKSTISHQINKLLKLGFIEEKAPLDSSQRKLKLKIRGEIGHVAGIFLGTTKLTIIIFTLDMRIVAEKNYFLDSISEPESCNREIIKQLKTLCQAQHIDSLWGIGIGFPFPVNFREGKPDSPPNVPLWHGYPLKQLYEQEFGCPVLVDNDVNVMALGEGYMGCTQNEPNFLFIKVGTGIGAGLIVDGIIYRGANGCAGDIGHIAVDGSSVQCHCGNRGCLEAVAGGKALAAKAEQKAASGESPFLAARLKANGHLKAVDINDGAIEGDLTCIQLIKDAGHAIGEVSAKLVNFFNPSSIVVGGGLSGFGNLFIGAIRESVIRRSLHLATYELNVCISELKQKSGPTGAGTLILDHIFSSEEFSTTLERLPFTTPHSSANSVQI
ncbi:MAG: ROK family transcriptional regulator [Spirochaetaceae bacterium]|nr:ROK family transcriptional regulator [Spirochaetaceae bacterium]MCF7949562.1 ROK family transcriptional regulator [Spirochaetia bacterium]MCF7952000.1 ROK family transcriptional regulator [Spirochaetaceae bacterium]